ncbi:MAG: hypothetical protein AAGF67_18675 [Verrucomicrobiota bacterium]
MNDPKSSNGKLVIWLVISILIAGILIAIRPSVPLQKEAKLSQSETSEKKATNSSSPDETVFGEPEEKSRQNSGAPVNDFAVAVEGDPLVVTLAYRPEIGPISIERYDSEGQPTGEPLKTGTSVQIPDPNKPGDKITFTIP